MVFLKRARGAKSYVAGSELELTLLQKKELKENKTNWHPKVSAR